MLILRNIPNLFTSLNLLCGCIGIVYVTSGQLVYAAFFVWLGAFFDFLDGFSARLLNVQSDIGKEHDSLADMVSFGVLPSFVVYKLLEGEGWVAYAGFLIAIFSALRLAKFNVDDRQHNVFIGLPTPANALFFTGLVLDKEGWLGPFLTQFPTLLVVTVVMSLLMISPLKFAALKFDQFKWAGNELKYLLMIVSMILFALMGIEAISLIVVWYIGISLAGNMLSKL